MNKPKLIDNHNQLCEAIKQLPCFIPNNEQPITIKRIEAGQSSLCFEVMYNAKKYFVKYDANADFFDNELKMSKAASTINLSPYVVYTGKHWLVNEFIDGVTLDESQTSIEAKIDIALNLMNKCHSLEVPLPLLNVTEIIKGIISNTCFSSSQQTYVKELLSKLPILSGENRVVCHGDINFSNVITLHNNAWLIDFECACLADKEFEIAMFFAINLLNVEQQKYALTVYEKLPSINFCNSVIDQKKLNDYLLYSYLINGLWYFEKAKELNITTFKKAKLYTSALDQFTLFDHTYPDNSSLSYLMQ